MAFLTFSRVAESWVTSAWMSVPGTWVWSAFDPRAERSASRSESRFHPWKETEEERKSKREKLKTKGSGQERCAIAGFACKQKYLEDVHTSEWWVWSCFPHGRWRLELLCACRRWCLGRSRPRSRRRPPNRRSHSDSHGSPGKRNWKLKLKSAVKKESLFKISSSDFEENQIWYEVNCNYMSNVQRKRTHNFCFVASSTGRETLPKLKFKMNKSSTRH